MADPRVVAVTPLFWHPDRGVYWMFDFGKDGKIVDKSPTYELIQRLPRLRGSPEYAPDFGNVARSGAPATASGPRLRHARCGSPIRTARASGCAPSPRARPARSRWSRTARESRPSASPKRTAARPGGPCGSGSGAEGWMAADFLTPVSATE